MAHAVLKITIMLYCRKLTGSLKLFHDRFARNLSEHEAYTSQFKEALVHNEQIRNCLNKVTIPALPAAALP